MIEPLDNGLCKQILSVVIKHSLVPLAILDEKGNFLATSPSLTQTIKYSPAELKRLRFQEITDPSDINTLSEMLHSAHVGDLESFDMPQSNYITKSKDCVQTLFRVAAVELNGQVTCFVLQIAPQTPVSLSTEKRSSFISTPLQWLASHWEMVAALTAASGLIVATAIEKLAQ